MTITDTHGGAYAGGVDSPAPSAATQVRVPVTAEDVLALLRDPQWLADRDAVLTMVALRGLATPLLYSPSGLALTGLMLWNDQSSIGTPPEAVVDLFDTWYADPQAHHQVSVQVWQIVLYGLAHDYLLPAMGATHYRLAFHPNRDCENPVRATVPRPHHSDRIRYSTIVHVPWPQILARLIATINTVAATHAPA